jgi:competence protein ComEC
VLGLSAMAGFAGRARPILKWLLTVLIALSLGFAAAQGRTALVAAPVLAKEQWADVSGQVLDVEVDPPGARVTLDHVAIAFAWQSRDASWRCFPAIPAPSPSR